MLCHPRPIILPLLFLFLLSAQKCDVDTVVEKVTVLPDGGMEVFFQHTAGTVGRIMDSDPPPSLEAGWDSVHVGLTREDGKDRHYLRAWTEIPPGADLPGSYASPHDPLSEWYVRFPSELVMEERGDTVFFRYSRTYPALPWNPGAFFEDLEQEMKAAETAYEGLEASELGEFRKKWEDSGAVEKAKEEGDSATLRQYQVELKDILVAGSPSPPELYRKFFSTWVKSSLWSDLAFSIPVGERFCREAIPEPMKAVLETVTGVLEGYSLSEEQTIAALLAEAEVEPDPTVFPGLVSTELELWDESWIEDLAARVQDSVRITFLRECQLSGHDLIEFDRRLAWLNDRYRISDLEIRKQRHLFNLVMPGELIETNADTVAEGRAEWRFGIRELFEREVSVIATSHLVRER